MDTFNYMHSKSIIFRGISSSNMAIGNSKNTVNKIYVFNFASSVGLSSIFTPKDDLLRLGLVLLELNGVKFEPRTGIDDNHTDTNMIIDSLLKKWDENYVKVSWPIFFSCSVIKL